MNNSSNRLLLLAQSHAHVAALMDCVPHIRANYAWVWVVYSPAVLADPATVEKDFDQQINDLTRAMREASAREDFAGADAYKIKRDAAILEKSAKVKDAWKALTKEQQDAAVGKLFRPFFEAVQGVDGMSCAITQGPDHFETGAHVEFQNSLKAGMKPGYAAGEYVVAWPTSLPKNGLANTVPIPVPIPVPAPATEVPDTFPKNGGNTVTEVVKKKGRPPMEPRLRELMSMTLDDLGPIAFELGIKLNDPIAGNRMKLVYRINELEKERTEKELAKL